MKLYRWITRHSRREALAVKYRLITGEHASDATLDLLDDPEAGGPALELLKMGVPADDLADAIASVRVVASRAECSLMYAAEFVANVRLFTDAPLAPPMLAQWLKPEETR